MKRSGTANLPLRAEPVPAWLAGRMTQRGTAIAEHIVISYGASEFLSPLSDPFLVSGIGMRDGNGRAFGISAAGPFDAGRGEQV
jgi:hypothetical protein